MGRRYYSAQKIGQTRARLISNAGYIKPTAIAEGVSMSTVVKWGNGEIPPHVTAEDVDAATAKASVELAALWEKAATLGATGLISALEDPERVRKMSARDLALAAAIATDKRNLLTGQATERVETMTLSDFLRDLPSKRAVSGTAAPVLSLPAVGTRDTEQLARETLSN